MQARVFLLPLLLAPATAAGQNLARLQEVAFIKGVQSNHLLGMGVVVGLSGTGDSNLATRARLASFLAHNNINVDPGQLASGNIALVSISSEIPPFVREGSRIDITLSAVGDCTSLFGGELLFATLKGIDQEVYVVAQGPVSIGGFSAGGGAAKVTRNHPTVGRIPGGGLVEKCVPMRLLTPEGDLEICLNQPAEETAASLARALSTLLPGRAETVDAGLGRLKLPPEERAPGRLIPLIARIKELPIQVGGRSRVVINERTGTIVIGEHVRIGRCAIAKGNLTVTVTETPEAAMRQGFSGGETTLLPRTSVEVVEGRNNLNFLEIRSTASLSDVVEMMNALGAAPRDIIDILQNLHRAGVLHAQLEIL